MAPAIFREPVSSGHATRDQAATPKQEFAAFLANVQPLRKKSNSLLDHCNTFIGKVNSFDSTYSGWDAAVRCLKRQHKLDTRLSDALAAIVPPPHLRHAYLAYVGAYRLDAQVDGEVAQTLRARQLFNWDTYNGRYRQHDDAVSRFLVAVIAYAASNGFGVPGWVHHIGG